MAISRQVRRALRGHSSFSSLVAAAAWLCVGCQADISGGPDTPGGAAGPNTPGPGGGPGPGSMTGGPGAPVEEPTDWFEAVTQADCTAVAATRTRIRRLGHVQWKNTVSASLGANTSGVALPEDAVSSATGFNTDADLNKVNVLLANAYFTAGDSLAPAAATAAMASFPCLGTSAADAACSAPFLKDVGGKLFRRPLTDEEVSRYGAFLTAQAALDPAATAVASTIRVMLLSPSMVYLTELGSSTPGDVTLTPYEQASLISYTIADSPPDQPLVQAALSGALNTSSERVAQAQRLMQLPAAHAKYATFWQQYLPLGDLRKATDLDPALVTSIEGETTQHFEKIVWQQNGSFADLLTAPYTYGDPSLSTIYGTLTPNGMGAQTLPAGQRSGFITQAGFLFSPDDASIPHKVIHRGLTVRRRLLCQSPPPPPANLMPNPADLAPLGADATPVESFEAFKQSKPACAACHVTFQPIGLAFEEFDGLGRYRTMYENGKPILTSGVLEDAGDASGPYANAVEIGQHIGNSKIGEYCFSRQFAEFSLGRHLNASVDACVIRAASDTQANPPVQKLAVVLSDLQAGTHRVHN